MPPRRISSDRRTRAWTTGDGPRRSSMTPSRGCLSAGVLLPGVTTLTRFVARVRAEATQRLWVTLSGLPNARQRRMLERLLDVAGWATPV